MRMATGDTAIGAGSGKIIMLQTDLAIQSDATIALATRVALNAIAVPVFTITLSGTIVYANVAGNELLRMARVFHRAQDKLIIRRKTDATALAEAVARVCHGGEPELLRFLTRQGEVTALVRIEPIPGEELVVVCVTELRAAMLLVEGWAKAAFGFSPQNAALAESLAIGVNLSEFSVSRRLPIGTVRTRMKKLLAQTGMSSQAALAAVLLRGATIMTGVETLRSSTVKR
jgi:hypothetical protein